jgi:hypothetical protein
MNQQTDAPNRISKRTESAEVERLVIRAERLLEIGRAAAPEWREPWRSTEHGDLLYGEDGLPR